MNVQKYIEKVKDLLIKARRRNPIQIQSNSSGIQITREDTTFNPKKDEHSGRTYLVTLTGMDTRVSEVKEFEDDLLLEDGDKHIAITSKPLIIEGNRFYYTKPGFQGTMALNKDTLLAGDVYQPSKSNYERKISKDINIEKLDFNPEEKASREDEEFYYIDSKNMGDVASLHGSKATLKEMNKAKRLRKLLKPSKVDKTKLIMAVIAGISVGFVLYPRVMKH